MSLRVASLFSGIGGFEVGLSGVGATPLLFCENDPSAKQVLRTHFPKVEIADDVQTLKELPSSDLLVAGWPCQDLSQAGQTSGLSGSRSSLIEEVFRIVENSDRQPDYILLENVAFALSLNGGEALKFATEQLEKHGYNWAFRILDSNFFDLPQRRRRLFILGSRAELPEHILFDAVEPQPTTMLGLSDLSHVGFYWTEGNRGIGWTNNAIPPLKGGSNLSIPSPPAIWEVGTDEFYTPSMGDAEQLQGFEVGWTLNEDQDSRASKGKRWRQVGNAVSVNVAKWLGERLISPTNPTVYLEPSSEPKGANAGWGGVKRNAQFFRRTFEGPTGASPAPLNEFGLKLKVPLSQRAAKGFYGRYINGSLKQNREFSDALLSYCTSFNSDTTAYSRVA